MERSWVGASRLRSVRSLSSTNRGSALGFRNLTTTPPDPCSSPTGSEPDYALKFEKPIIEARPDPAQWMARSPSVGIAWNAFVV